MAFFITVEVQERVRKVFCHVFFAGSIPAPLTICG
nr:MAG TPA: hypothetical protein [Caudoviricetes sp.]